MLICSDQLTLNDVLTLYTLIAYITLFGLSYYLFDNFKTTSEQLKCFYLRVRIETKGFAAWRYRAPSLTIVTLLTQAFSDLVILITDVYVEAEDVAIIGICIRIVVLVGFAKRI